MSFSFPLSIVGVVFFKFIKPTNTARAEGHHGPTRNDLIDALRQTDTTQSFLSGLREIVRPEHQTTESHMDPELRQWLALRPNLPVEQQAVIDGLAMQALSSLRSRLEASSSSANVTPGPAARTQRAFASNWEDGQ